MQDDRPPGFYPVKHGEGRDRVGVIPKPIPGEDGVDLVGRDGTCFRIRLADAPRVGVEIRSTSESLAIIPVVSNSVEVVIDPARRR